jgi:hypothetical protein
MVEDGVERGSLVFEDGMEHGWGRMGIGWWELG